MLHIKHSNNRAMYAESLIKLINDVVHELNNTINSSRKEQLECQLRDLVGLLVH